MRDNEDNGGNGNETGLDSSLRGRLDAILVHVGETRKGIRSLESGQAELKKAIEALREEAIPRALCEEKHQSIQRQFESLEQLLAALRKTGTGTGHPTVGATPPSIAPSNTGPYRQVDLTPIPTAVEEVLEKRQERRRSSLSFYLSAAGGAIAIISALSVAVVKLVHLVDKVERTAEASAQNATNQVERVRRELSQEIANQRIVYVKAQAPDAGPPLPPKRVPRRRVP